MDKSEIISKINYYNNLVDEYTAKRVKMEQQISELSALSGKFSSLQSDFVSKQTIRKNGLSKLFSKGSSIKAIKQYYSGMYNLLTGSEYTTAKNGISSAKSAVDKKKKQLQSELNDVNRQLSSSQSNLNYWKYQLAIYKEPEE